MPGPAETAGAAFTIIKVVYSPTERECIGIYRDVSLVVEKGPRKHSRNRRYRMYRYKRYRGYLRKN